MAGFLLELVAGFVGIRSAPRRPHSELLRRETSLDALANMDPHRHAIEGIEHDGRAADLPVKRALGPSAIEEGQTDAPPLASPDIAEQADHGVEARVEADDAIGYVGVESEGA